MIEREKFTTPNSTWYALAKDSAGTMPQIWLSVPESPTLGEVAMMRTVAPAGHPVEEYEGSIAVERSETELILAPGINGTGPTETVLADMTPVVQLIGELATYSHAAKLDKVMAVEGSDLCWKISTLKDRIDSFLAPQHGPAEPFAERTDRTSGRGRYKMHRIGYRSRGNTLWLVEPYRVNGEYHTAEIAEADPTGKIFCIHCELDHKHLVSEEILPTVMRPDEREEFMSLLDKTERLLVSVKTIRDITRGEQMDVSKALVTIEKRAVVLARKAFDLLAPRGL